MTNTFFVTFFDVYVKNFAKGKIMFSPSLFAQMLVPIKLSVFSICLKGKGKKVVIRLQKTIFSLEYVNLFDLTSKFKLCFVEVNKLLLVFLETIIFG